MLKEVGDRVGRYAFAHALVRRRSTTASRACAARGCTRAWARRSSPATQDDLDPWLPQLARHFERAAPVEGPARAIDFALAAGRRADRLLAWEEAAQHYRGALRARQATSAARDRTGAELLLALGASEERAGLEAARESFTTALEVAHELGDPALLARAALGVAGPWSTLGREDPEVVAVLEEALGGRGGGLAAARAAACPPVARALLRGPARAADGAQRGGGRDRPPHRRPGDAGLRARRAPLRAVAARRTSTSGSRWPPSCGGSPRRSGDIELELEGAGWTVVDLLELGDVAGADIQIDAAAALAAVVQRPLYLWWTSLFRCTRAQLDGEFAEAERLAGETLAIGQRGHAENALHYYAMAMFNIRREQGRLGEVEDAVARFIEMYPAIPAWRCTQALMHVELGRPERGARGVRGRRGAGLRRAAARRQLADRADPRRRGGRGARRR